MGPNDRTERTTATMIDRVPVVRANSVRMKRSQHSGTFLLVEGHDDRLFISKFICCTACKIEVVENKRNVQDVLEILDEAGLPGILGVTDADFDRVTARSSGRSGLVMHDHHDLETMLFRSEALGHILREFGSQPKLTRFGGDVLQALVERALPVGYLRMYSAVAELGLTFQGMDYSRWVDRSSFQADEDRLIQHVKNRSNRQDVAADILRNGMTEMARSNFDPFEIVNGDDLIGILLVGLRSVLGNQSGTSLQGEDVKRALRLSYSDEQFLQSGLCRSIKEWEVRNPGFRVLRRR